MPVGVDRRAHPCTIPAHVAVLAVANKTSNVDANPCKVYHVCMWAVIFSAALPTGCVVKSGCFGAFFESVYEVASVNNRRHRSRKKQCGNLLFTLFVRGDMTVVLIHTESTPFSERAFG